MARVETDRDKASLGKLTKNDLAEPVVLGKPKTIRSNGGKVRKQYPAHPGYHGSGDEKKLNPEE